LSAAITTAMLTSADNGKAVDTHNRFRTASSFTEARPEKEPRRLPPARADHRALLDPETGR
jgi:hypothetical protein